LVVRSQAAAAKTVLLRNAPGDGGIVYDYRKMTGEERDAVLRHRKSRRLPWHAPPHFADAPNVYVISAACFEHRPLLGTTERLAAFEGRLVHGLLSASWADVRAWVVMPTHYHILARLDLNEFRRWVHRLHNATATTWNREDQCPGRRVWFRFGDRRIRGERHYWATVNYLHANPVRHDFAAKAPEWPFSSVHRYLDDLGKGRLISLWKEFPVDRYGDGWDD